MVVVVVVAAVAVAAALVVVPSVGVPSCVGALFMASMVTSYW